MTAESFEDDVRRRAREDAGATVRVGFFGQPGAGKSSLINALTGKELAEVGEGTDTTVREAPYEWNNLLLVDLPGYGTSQFPASTYFDRFKILTLDVVVCITAGKFTDSDTAFFRKLSENGRRCIYVRTKSDAMWRPGKDRNVLREEVRLDFAKQVGSDLPVIFTSCVTLEGLDDLQNAIAANLTGVKRDRYVRSAKAYSRPFLERKKDACRRFATFAVAAAALGNMVPIPGIGVTADVTALSAIVTKVMADYGIDLPALRALAEAKDIAPALAPLVRDIIAFAGREGLLWLLKQFAGRVVVAEAAKWVPFVGSALAGSVSFILMRQLAFHVIDRCHDYALAILDAKFEADQTTT